MLFCAGEVPFWHHRADSAVLPLREVFQSREGVFWPWIRFGSEYYSCSSFCFGLLLDFVVGFAIVTQISLFTLKISWKIANLLIFAYLFSILHVFSRKIPNNFTIKWFIPSSSEKILTMKFLHRFTSYITPTHPKQLTPLTHPTLHDPQSYNPHLHHHLDPQSPPAATVAFLATLYPLLNHPPLF